MKQLNSSLINARSGGSIHGRGLLAGQKSLRYAVSITVITPPYFSNAVRGGISTFDWSTKRDGISQGRKKKGGSGSRSKYGK